MCKKFFKLVSWSNSSLGLLNFNAYLNTNHSTTSVFVFRDDFGKVLHNGSTLNSATNPLQAKALALLSGVKATKELNYSQLHIEDDCLSLINASETFERSIGRLGISLET